jgi:SAM-dependent methyltransferase
MAGSPLSARDFWNRPASVRSMDRSPGTEPYEDLLLADAVALAGGAERVRTVHVLGVGTGRELPAVRAAAPRARLLAWDVSDAMVQGCRERVARDGPDGVDVAQRAAGDLTPADGRAELVVGLNAVLGYVVPAAERVRTLRALADVLVPGGVLAGVVQQRRGRPDWAAWFLAHDAAAMVRGREAGDRPTALDGVSVLHHHVTPRELRGLLAGAGLEPVTVQSLRAHLRGRWPDGPPRRSPNPLVFRARRPG